MTVSALLPKRVKWIVIVGSWLCLFTTLVPTCLWRIDFFLRPEITNGIFEAVLATSFVLLIIGFILLVFGAVIWIRLRPSLPLFPMQSLWHKGTVIVFITFVAHMNTREDWFVESDGVVERYLGWPIPVAEHVAMYYGTFDNPVFCCSRDGGFSLEHFREHPELYQGGEDVRWEAFWPLAIPNFVFLIVGAGVLAHIVEFIMKRGGISRKAFGNDTDGEHREYDQHKNVNNS